MFDEPEQRAMSGLDFFCKDESKFCLMLCTPVSPSVPRTYTGVGVGWGGGILFRENNIPLMKFMYLVFSHARRELEQVTEIFVAMFA